MVSIEYKDDSAPSEERLLWELEPQRSLLEPNALPDVFDPAGVNPLAMKEPASNAALRVPDAMVTEFQALGTREMVRDRLRKHREVGVTTLKLGLDSAGPIGRKRFELPENIVDLVEGL